jgi:DNA mismatch repair protein MutL
LPPLLVNQIAAGEVIERPASVIKEAIENSIDAGATRIDVAIECGGRELIRVSDDGCGIATDELTLAVAPHATSKIEAADDLDAIATMGFRGEAIASIASVSRLSLTSRSRDQETAGTIEVEGDDVRPPRPSGGPVGTTLLVRNLFFNTPARRKFLRTDQTEASRCREVVETLAVAHPAIAFTLSIDGRSVLDLPAGQTTRRRAVSVLGEDLEPELLELQASDRGVRLWGLIGRPGIARSTSRQVRVYLNGRAISDRSITHAIKEAYRGLIEPSRHPTVVLFLEMDPAQVDVNVHPAKAEVRFRNQSAVHGAVLRAVRGRLQEADLLPDFDLDRAPGAAAAQGTRPAGAFGSGLPPAPARSGASVDDFVDYFRRLDPKQQGFVYTEVKQALAEEPEAFEEAAPTVEPPPAAPPPLPTVQQATRVMQVHASYIVTQDEEGLVIIDQHALHERVMFEKLKARLAASNLESQRLLMPATIRVERSRMELLETLAPLLERIGIDAQPMGPDTIAIHAFTSLLFERKVEPEPFMTDLLDTAAGRGLSADTEAALHEVLDMMACKAAVKAGDRLTDAEIAELLQYRDTVDRSSRCPHGRPTSLRLTIQDLDRQFGRI